MGFEKCMTLKGNKNFTHNRVKKFKKKDIIKKRTLEILEVLEESLLRYGKRKTFKEKTRINYQRTIVKKTKCFN